jgi:hypothetical protein
LLSGETLTPHPRLWRDLSPLGRGETESAES